MTEEKLVEEILEIASELDRGDITFDEAQTKAQTLVKIDRYEQLTIPDVVDSEAEYCDRCGEFKEINGVSGYCDDCRPKNR